MSTKTKTLSKNTANTEKATIAPAKTQPAPSKPKVTPIAPEKPKQLEEKTPQNTSSSSPITDDEYFVPLGASLDISSIVIEDPITHSFKKNDTTIEWTTSEVYSYGSNGEKRKIYIQLSKQHTFGVSGSYPLEVAAEDRCLENLEGFQVCYPMTSLKTINNPTDEERATKQIMDDAFDITVDALKRFCEVAREDRLVPSPTYSAYSTAARDKDWDYAVKRPYEHASSNDKSGKKIKDLSKPRRTYLKFATKGKGAKITCETQIYGPGDKLVTPYHYMSKPGGNSIRGDSDIVIIWDNIFWGAHGRSSHGASLRFRVAQMNFTPTAGTTLTTRRLLPPNTTPAELDIDDETEADYFAPPVINKNDFEKVEIKKPVVTQAPTQPAVIEPVQSQEDEPVDDAEGEGEDDDEEVIEEPVKPPPKKVGGAKSAKTTQDLLKRRREGAV